VLTGARTIHEELSQDQIIKRSLTMKTRAACLGLILMSCALPWCVVVTDGWAQGRQKYVTPKAMTATAKYTQTHIIEVGDVPNHQLRIFELQTVYTAEAPAFDGVKVKERFARAVSDYIDGSGTATGYAINILENGDKVFERLSIQAQTAVAPDGTKKLGFRSVSTLTGGTGRFTGIRGTLLGGGGSDLRTGLSDTWTEGEYWFEK
jgi:hypothetical protein